MTPKGLLATAVDPALELLADLTAVPSDDRARLMIMAIAGQESAWEHRRQIGGPARSFWQFEKGGGVAGLFQVAPEKLGPICTYLHVPFDPGTVFEAMAWNDTLATCMARLLLWTDPAPLPAVGDVQAGWAYYQRNWRPGLPHPEIWPARYGTALGLLSKETT
ncbi:MAG: hypothetical protein JSR91_00145 [Proteobacteria bacterium]|nr:hypothetical protein [Pseudomonadota bacterium]